jgi:hypothetical protein
MNNQDSNNIIPFPISEDCSRYDASKTACAGLHQLKHLMSAHRYSAAHTLLRLVLDAVEPVEWPNKSRSFGLNESYKFDSNLLMVLEVYCYAQGIYESNKVAEHAMSDPVLSDVFSPHGPNGLMIRRFRREHHSYIKECLLLIFDVAFQVRFGASGSNETPVDYCVAQAIDTWFEPICGPQPAKEAEERIDQAIFWDGMAMAS